VKDLLKAKSLPKAEIVLTFAFKVGGCWILRARWKGNPACEQRCKLLVVKTFLMKIFLTTVFYMTGEP
jgi:hypothetical protein